jgi:hypothetical protein
VYRRSGAGCRKDAGGLAILAGPFQVRPHPSRCAGRLKFDRTLRYARGLSKCHRTLRCARDPCPADGLAPPGCARPRRQPLVRVAPGSIRDRSCRTSRLSTPRARGPVLAAGARTRDGHDEYTRNMNIKRGGEAIAEPTPLERTAPGPLAGGAVAAPCRPPRKAMGPVPCVTRTSPIVTARPTRNQRITPNIRGILLAPRPQTSNDESAPPRRSVPGGVRWRRFQPSSSPHGTLPPSHPARPRRRLRPLHRHPVGPIRRALTPRP